MQDRVVFDPNILGGKPVIKGTRISKVNVTNIEEWDKVAAAVRQKLEELAEMKEPSKE